MEHVAQLTATLEEFVRHYGALAVFLILALEALGLPVPGETLLIFSSISAGRGEISLPTLLLCAWLGSVLGDNIGYIIGRTLGRKTISRFGARVGLTNARMASVERVFKRYGPVTVLFARFFNILRQLNGIVAGMLGMAWWRFLIFNALGAALWVAAWVFAAHYFATHIAGLSDMAKYTAVAAVILVAACVLAVLWLRRRHSRG